ncbi:arylamine N-acetyltransferase [Vibrio fluvialis]
MDASLLTQYFERIGLSDTPTLDERGLRLLHQNQHRSIPFENFDVVSGKGIDLDPAAVFHKLVKEKRGGYCFEVNGLLLRVMQTLGFDARPLLGRVHLSGQPTGRSHQLSLVMLGELSWLVDAGFGANTPRQVMPLVLNREMTFDYQTLRFVERADYGVMLQSKNGDEWSDLYSLDLGFVCPADIQYGNHFTSTHPSSVFTNACVAVMPTPNGITTLLNNKLTIRDGNNTEQILLNDEHSYFSALKQHFGIAPHVPFDVLKGYFGE